MGRTVIGISQAMKITAEGDRHGEQSPWSLLTRKLHTDMLLHISKMCQDLRTDWDLPKCASLYPEGRLLRVAKRKSSLRGLWIVLLAATLVGVLIGFGGAAVRKPMYSSSAQLSWDPSSLRYTNSAAYVPDSVSLGEQVGTQALQILSDSVVTPAAEALGVSAQSIRNAVKVTSSTSSTQITVSGSASSASEATGIVSALVKSYQQQVTSTFGEQYSTQAKALQTPIDALQQQLAGLPAAGPLTDAIATQLANLQTQQVVLQSQSLQPMTPLSVIRVAGVSTSPSGPSAATLAVVGGSLGLLIGLAISGLVLARRGSRQHAFESADIHRVRTDLGVA